MTVAKYPVDVGDDEGIVDAVNYLLSGPAGLGQNFQGYSAYLPAYLRPSSKQPWSLDITSTLNPSVYLDFPISNIVPLGGNPSDLLVVTFTTPLANAPFQFGDTIDIRNVVETGSDTSIQGASWVVYSCTTTDVTVGYDSDFGTYDWNTYVSGGNVIRDYTNYALSTDCNARVTVIGPTDQVFVTAQINFDYAYVVNTASDYSVDVQITRLSGIPSDVPGSNDYVFVDPVVVSKRTFTENATTSGSNSIEAIFTTVLDGPNLNFGYYWYILELVFYVPGSIFIETDSRNFDVTGTKPILASTTTYSSISPTSTTGIGSGLVVDVTLDATASVGTYIVSKNTTIDVTNGGVDYNIGDILTIPGTSLGGATPTNDMTLVVTALGGAVNIEPGIVTTTLRSLTAQVIKQ